RYGQHMIGDWLKPWPARGVEPRTESASSNFSSAPHVRNTAAFSRPGAVREAIAFAIARSVLVGWIVRRAVLCRNSWRSGRGLGIDALAHRDGVQLGVGRLLFVEIGIEEANDVLVTKLLGPCDQGAVAANLVMLDGLRAGNDRRIQDLWNVVLAAQLASR